MKTFTTDESINITAFATKEEAALADWLSAAKKELANLTAEWPISSIHRDLERICGNRPVRGVEAG